MYRKKRRSWTKHVDFMLLDVLCMQLAFVISYIIRFGTDNPYTDGDYRTLAIAFLFIDFFVEIVSDSFKNVLKRGYFDEFIATCRHVILVELIVTFYLFTTQTGSFYSTLIFRHGTGESNRKKEPKKRLSHLPENFLSSSTQC